MNAARVRIVAIEMWKSHAMQALIGFSSFKLFGEAGSFAHRCTEAAKVFCEVEQKASSAKVAEIALSLFCSRPGVFGQQNVRSLTGIATNVLEQAEGVYRYMTTELVEPVVAEDPVVVAPVEEPEVVEPEAPAVKWSTVIEEVKPEPEPVAAAPVDEQSSEPVDVPTEKLDLPPKVIEALLQQSRPDYDLTTARKIRVADKQRSLVELKVVGEAIRKKILEAVDAAIGPE